MASVLDDIPESHRELVEAPLTAVLTTLDEQGRPQSTAVWYLLDDDGLLKASITIERQKYKNLSRSPQCSLFIMDPANPYRTLEIRAVAELEPDPDKAMVTKFARNYHADEQMLRAAGGDRYTVVLRPRRIVANPPADV